MFHTTVDKKGDNYDCFSIAICTKIKGGNVSYLVISLANEQMHYCEMGRGGDGTGCKSYQHCSTPE